VPKRSTQKKSAWGPSQASEPDHGHEKQQKLHRRGSSGIGISEIPGARVLCISESRFAISRSAGTTVNRGGQVAGFATGSVDQLTGQSVMSHRGSKNRKSREHKHHVIKNAETPMGVWLRSHRDRSYGPCSSR
jgi:hypothetical protein